jgi:hypothetical protein
MNEYHIELDEIEQQILVSYICYTHQRVESSRPMHMYAYGVVQRGRFPTVRATLPISLML